MQVQEHATLYAMIFCTGLGTALLGCKESNTPESAAQTVRAATPPTEDDGSRFVIERDGKYGYIDRTGVERIAPRFAGGSSFSEGLAAVQVENNGRWGYVDTGGRVVIEPQFELVHDFSEGLAVVKVGERYGYLDKSGVLALPARFVSAEDFDKDDCAFVTSPGRGWYGEQHWIDRSGEKVTAEDNPCVGRETRTFSVTRSAKDKDSLFTVTPEYSNEPVRAVRTVVRDKNSRGLIGVFDVFVLNTEYNWRVLDRTDRNKSPHWVVCKEAKYRKQSRSEIVATSARCGLLDAQGTTSVPLLFDGIQYLGQNRAAIAVGSPPLRDIDWSSAAWRGPWEYWTMERIAWTSNGWDFANRLRLKKDARRWGLVEVPGGKALANPVFDSIEPYREGLAVASFAGKYGYLGTDGKWAIEPKFARADAFRDGLAEARLNERVIYIDKTGKEIAPKTDEKYAPDEDTAGRDSRPSAAVARVGTGFFFSSAGDVVTNAHVVDGCKRVENAASGETANSVIMEKRLDLALVRFGQMAPAFVRVRQDGPQLGEQLTVFGFPLDGLLASSGVATFGNVSALSGPDDRTDVFQMSAQVGPGSSGGPVLDAKGTAIGIVVARLDDRKLVAATGAVPQNTNFAVKSSALLTFLSSHGVTPTTPSIWTMSKSQEDLSKLAAAATTKLRCVN